jgi:hypothetical protein
MTKLIKMMTLLTSHAAVNVDDVDDNDDPVHTARRRGEAFAGIAVIIGTGWMQMLRPYSIAANTGDTMPRHGIAANTGDAMPRHGIAANTGDAMPRHGIAANAGDAMPRHGIDIVDGIHTMHVTCV